MRRERLAAALGLLVVVVGLALVLMHRTTRLAGTNSRVVASARGLDISPGKERCQRNEAIAKGTRAVWVYANARGRGARVELAVRMGTRTISRGVSPRLRGTGRLQITLSPVARDLLPVTVCLHNLGPGRMGFAGNRTALSREANGADGARDDVRLDYLRPGRESWVQIAPTVARRFGLVKASFVGSWTMWIVLTVVVLLWIPGLAVVLRRRT